MYLNCTFSSDDNEDFCGDIASSVLSTISGLQRPGPYDKPQPLISSDIKYLLEIYMNVVTFMVTSIIGIAANVVNVIVYWKMGLKDSIALGFFALSNSDLILVCMTFCTSIWYFLKINASFSYVDFLSIHYATSATIRNMFYSLSSALTAFLCLERCCCVILPFRVRILFSRTRSALMIIAIISFHILCFIPLFATHQLRWQPKMIKDNNGTMITTNILRIYFLPHRQEIENINTILAGVVAPTLAQAIVIVSIFIMIRGLRASSQFRKSVASATSSVQASSVSAITESGKSGLDDNTSKNENQNNAKERLTSRDARLVKTMIFLVIIFSISNVPLLMITYAKRLVPELNFRRRYHNTVTVSYSVIYILSAVNATANVFVYYTTSIRFREMTQKLFCYKTIKGK